MSDIWVLINIFCKLITLEWRAQEELKEFSNSVSLLLFKCLHGLPLYSISSFFLIYQKWSKHHTISQPSSFIHSSIEEASIAITLFPLAPNCHSGERRGMPASSQGTLLQSISQSPVTPKHVSLVHHEGFVLSNAGFYPQGLASPLLLSQLVQEAKCVESNTNFAHSRMALDRSINSSEPRLYHPLNEGYSNTLPSLLERIKEVIHIKCLAWKSGRFRDVVCVHCHHRSHRWEEASTRRLTFNVFHPHGQVALHLSTAPSFTHIHSHPKKSLCSI